MDKNTKHKFYMIAFGIVLFWGLSNIKLLWLLLGKIGSVTAPIWIGFLMAFVLHVPVCAFEKLLLSISEKLKWSIRRQILYTVSIFLSLVCIIALLGISVVLILPELSNSMTNIIAEVETQWPVWIKTLELYWPGDINIFSWVEELDMKQTIEQIIGSANSMVTVIAGTFSTFLSRTTTFLLSVIIAIYVLTEKKNLARQARKLLYAYFDKTISDKVYVIASLIQTTYSKFLSGQCVEAFILGTLMFVFFLLFKLPYAGLIGVLTGILSFIPYVGAFASCFIGAVLIFLSNPHKVLIAIIVYQCVQFVENQFIYPRVVGNSVGLSPLWTLIALIIGGNLFGIMGMIFFIPLTSVLCTLISKDANQRLKKE